MYRPSLTQVPLQPQRARMTTPVLGGPIFVTISDSPVFADSMSRVIGSLRTVSDSPTSSDAFTDLKAAIRALSDNPTSSDAFADLKSAIRVLSDNPIYSDAFSVLRATTGALTDSATFSDALTDLKASTRALTDAPTFSDILADLKIAIRVLTDTSTFSDAETRAIQAVRTLLDSPSSSDLFTRSVINLRTLSDSQSFSDAFTYVLTIARTISDNPSTSDNFTQHSVLTRALSDSQITTDGITRSTITLHTLSDSLISTDDLSYLVTITRVMTDNPTTVTTHTRTIVSFRTLSDTAMSSDLLDRILIDVRALSDSPSSSDTVEGLQNVVVRLLNDSLTVSMPATQLFIGSRTLSDSSIFSDALTDIRTFSRINSAAITLNDNLISYWKLDEASGNALDAINTNNLTDVNGVTSITGKINGARLCTYSSGQFFQIASNPSLETGDIDLTIQAWVKFTSTGVTMGIAGKYSASKKEYTLYFDSNTLQVGFIVSSTGSDQTILLASNFGTVTTGVWYHLLGWHDSVNDTINIKVNGVLNSQSYSLGVFSGTSAFRIGAFDSHGAIVLDGAVDEVAFWKRVLTDFEQRALFNSGNGLSLSFTDYGDAPLMIDTLTMVKETPRIMTDSLNNLDSITRLFIGTRVFSDSNSTIDHLGGSVNRQVVNGTLFFGCGF